MRAPPSMSIAMQRTELARNAGLGPGTASEHVPYRRWHRGGKQECIKRALFALQSVHPNEMDWALSLLCLLSFEDTAVFSGLADMLAADGAAQESAVLDSELSLCVDLVISCAYRRPELAAGRGTAMRQVRRGLADRALGACLFGRPDDRWAAKEPDWMRLQRERGLHVATILRNWSLETHNASILGRNPWCTMFLLQAACGDNLQMRVLGSEALASLAHAIDLEALNGADQAARSNSVADREASRTGRRSRRDSAGRRSAALSGKPAQTTADERGTVFAGDGHPSATAGRGADDGSAACAAPVQRPNNDSPPTVAGPDCRANACIPSRFRATALRARAATGAALLGTAVLDFFLQSLMSNDRSLLLVGLEGCAGLCGVPENHPMLAHVDERYCRRLAILLHVPDVQIIFCALEVLHRLVPLSSAHAKCVIRMRQLPKCLIGLMRFDYEYFVEPLSAADNQSEMHAADAFASDDDRASDADAAQALADPRRFDEMFCSAIEWCAVRSRPCPGCPC